MAKVDIVLPCFNAELWLDSMITSLIQQDFEDWRIIARDDGSTDHTSDCLIKWSEKLYDRMIINKYKQGQNIGLIANYNTLLDATETSWVMLADDDDIWKKNKISDALRTIQKYENQIGTNTPIAIFTDAEVVDKNSNRISSSYWKWARQNPNRILNLKHVAMESPALGATMIINRSLLNLAMPVPLEVPYHDWWFVMAAVAFGKLIAVQEQTMLYRRHDSNITGNPVGSSFIHLLKQLNINKNIYKNRLQDVLINKSAKTSKSFLNHYITRLNAHDINILRTIVRLKKLNWINRRLTIIHNDLWFDSYLKNLGLLLFC